MSTEGCNVTRLDRKGRGHLVLHCEIATHGVGSVIVELNSAQSQATGVNQEGTQRCAGEPGLERRISIRAPSWTWCRAPAKSYRSIVISRRELEIELEWIILTQVRRESSVFKPIVEKAKSTPSHQFGTNLISKPKTWSKIGLLRIAQSFAVFVGDRKGNPVFCKQTGEARDRIGGQVVRVRSLRDDVHRRTRGRPTRHKVRLVGMVFIDQSEEIPAQAKIDGELGSDLPVILDVGAVIVLSVIGQRNIGRIIAIGGILATGTSHVIRAANVEVSDSAGIVQCPCCSLRGSRLEDW